MAHPLRNTAAQDADAIYIHEKIDEADRMDAIASSSTEQAKQNRLDAGKRLIEVRARYSDKKVSEYHKPGWLAWLKQNNIAQQTAHNLMRDAGFTAEQRDEHKAKERDRKREERAKKQGIVKMMTEKGLISTSTGSTKRNETMDKVAQLAGVKVGKGAVSKMSDEDHAKVVAAVETLAEAKEAPFEARVAEHRAEVATLPETAKQKFERLAAKEHRLLNEQFHAAVEKRVQEVLKDRIAHLEEVEEKALQELKYYQAVRNGVAAQIDKDDYRFLLNVLHPDRAPEDRKDKFSKAFDIVRKLESYVAATS
jgi:hypothetical protein